jgi:hypothetical protein
MLIEKLWWRLVQWAAACAGIIAAICALGIWANQGNVWLKTAIWYPYTVGQVLHDWGVGVRPSPLLGWQKVVDDVLAWPGTGLYVFVSVILWMIWVAASGYLASIEWKEQQTRTERERLVRESDERQERERAAKEVRGDFDFSKQVGDLVRRKRF